MASAHLAHPEGRLTIIVLILLSSLRRMCWHRRVPVHQAALAAQCHLQALPSIRSMPSPARVLTATSPLATISVEQPLTISDVTYSMARRIFPGSSVPQAVE